MTTGTEFHRYFLREQSLLAIQARSYARQTAQSLIAGKPRSNISPRINILLL